MSDASLKRLVPWFAVVGVLVAALSLRSPIVSPSPVMRDISADLNIDAGTAGLITTVPVLMFSLMTPLVAILIRRAGSEVALLIALIGVLLGCFVRAAGGFAPLLIGMFIIGAAITIGNVVIPVIIRREVPPERVSLTTAAYTATLNVGSLMTSLGTAPLAEAVGWSIALLAWTLLTIAGVVVWAAYMRRQRHARTDVAGNDLPVTTNEIAVITGPTPIIQDAGALAKKRLKIATLLLTLGFGMQSATYYGLTTWLPTIAADTIGLDAAGAGAVASLYQGVAVLGAFIVPIMNRVTPPIAAVSFISLCWIFTPLGLWLAPQFIVLWMCFGAVAHSGGFVVIFATIARVAGSDSEAVTMSAVIQGGGYVVAALCPPALGALHDATLGWSASLALLVALTSVYAVALITSSVLLRRRTPPRLR